MIIASAILSSIYIAICFYLSRGLKNINVNYGNSAEELQKKSVSVIICARNEEKNIDNILNCLCEQTYPKNLLQFIIVDDRSSDKTAEIILSYKEKFQNFAFVQITEKPKDVAPKKYAFNSAIKIAEGEIILQTDADSIVSSDWIEKSVCPFCDKTVALSQGVVKYRFDEKISPILKTYQFFDFYSHGIVAAAGIGKNIPLNANANNFAFRREIYENLGGYGKLDVAIGGDDGLLTQNFWQNGKKIVFNANSFVETKPEYSWKSLINQRKKWGSETRFYLPKQTAILAPVFIFYCFIICAILSTFIFWQNFYVIFLLFAIKIVGELFFMRKGFLVLEEKTLSPHIIWISPLNLFITIYSVFSGIFTEFEWKGERFKGKKIKLAQF